MSEENNKPEPYRMPFPPTRMLKPCGHCGEMMVVYMHPFHIVEGDTCTAIVLPHPEGPIQCDCGAIYLIKVVNDPPLQIQTGLLMVKGPDRKILTPSEALGLVPPDKASKVGH